jgi:hypothetical protein
MKLLVGNTGLIGTTLKDNIKFDYEFNSKNLEELLSLPIDTSQAELYLACLPATKWLVNKDPQSDLNNIFKILNIITKREYGTIILYSTIDVYNNVPLEVDEGYEIPITTPSYGSNRYLFENLIKTTVKYKKFLTIRLPALFGKHIKKNIIYDLLNNNEVEKIKYNSIYQWYNLDKLFRDTNNCLKDTQHIQCINLFTEPIHTSEILNVFKLTKEDVNDNPDPIVYNYKSRISNTGYVESKKDILEQIQQFVISHSISHIKIAVCFFGEERTLLNHAEAWERFSSKLNIDFYAALYSNPNIYNNLITLQNNLPLKSVYITENDLEYFDQLKFKAEHPIYIYGNDSKAHFNRIASQLFIRQKSVSLVNLKDYDLVILCRTDISGFNISYQDIYNTYLNQELLIVNSGTHAHPGGGGGCKQCSIEKRCDLEFHANDICDHWCIGSSSLMKEWTTIYDNVLELYRDIQKTSTHENVKHVKKTDNLEQNQFHFTFDIPHLLSIENDIHCFYPEKLMRPTFKNYQIIDATHDKSLWI